MTKGIVFVCHNIGHVLVKEVLVNFSRRNIDLQLCFLDNNSKDSTNYILQELKHVCQNIVALSIKRKLSKSSAERAGARYMFSNFRLTQLAFVDLNESLERFESMEVVFMELEKHHSAIFKDCCNEVVQKTARNELVNKTFSILKHLIDIKQNKNTIKFE